MFHLAYYRLRQIDLDGRYKLSPTVSAVLPSEVPRLLISPNPNDGFFTVRLPEVYDDEAHLRLLDVDGRTVWEAVLEENISEIGNGERLASGTYFLQVSCSQENWVEKMIVE